MPSSRRLITSTTLSSSAASVTFSGIPSGYKDLVLRYSVRSAIASTNDFIQLRINGLSTSIYSDTTLYSALTPLSTRGSSVAQLYAPRFSVNGGTTTSNTFSNGEIYIPSYTASQNKPVSGFAVTENNASDNAYKSVGAGLIQSTAAISSIELFGFSNYIAGSSFYLYGLFDS